MSLGGSNQQPEQVKSKRTSNNTEMLKLFFTRINSQCWNEDFWKQVKPAQSYKNVLLKSSVQTFH
jgi:hypothetical protein